jgi:hypothetical protein
MQFNHTQRIAPEGGLASIAQRPQFVGDVRALMGDWRQQRQDWRAQRPQWQGFEGGRPEYREAMMDWRQQRPNLGQLIAPFLSGYGQ